jgi:hypothetical protein
MKVTYRSVLNFSLLFVLSFLFACSDSDSDDDVTDDTSGDDTAGDDTIPYDDTLDDDTESWASGHWGYFAADVLHIFRNGMISTVKLLDLPFATTAVGSFEDAAFFATHEYAHFRVDRYYADELRMIYEYRDGDMGSNTQVDSAAPYSSEDALLMNYLQPDFPPDLIYYQPDLPIDPVGLFQGFRGGAYPFDATTIYSYDDTGLNVMAVITSGTLVAAAPYGDGFIAATGNEILTWDPSTLWTHLANGSALSIMTDPEGDILVERFDTATELYEYYAGDGSGLQLYTNFDVSSCGYGFLYFGDAKGFFCKNKPAGVQCDESWDNNSYLVTEDSGNVACQGLPFGWREGFMLIMW